MVGDIEQVRMGRELEISNGKDGERAGDIEW